MPPHSLLRSRRRSVSIQPFSEMPFSIMTPLPATQDEALSKVLGYVFSGAIGPPKGQGVGYALVEATPTAFSWLASLENIDGPPTPIDRYLIKIDRLSRDIYPPQHVILSQVELAEAILAATGQHLASLTRFTDGALSISYKVTVQESVDIAYVV